MIPKWQCSLWQLGLASVLSIGATLAYPGDCAKSQITPDDTLGTESSLVTPNIRIGNLPADQVDGGARRGANLFHSFREFNIAEGQQVFFTNPTGIENIFSRVTGTNSSKILGTLGVNGAANLFLLNPNGIIFGLNAKLNLGGSFVGTSARSIKFADGAEFSATNPFDSELLTLNVPIGLQYGQDAGRILVQGQGNKLSIDPNTGEVLEILQAGNLKVQPGQTLALAGGEVVLEGGSLSAESGRVEVWSVQGEGLVGLTPTNPGWELSNQGVQNFQEIRLSQAAAIDTSGTGGGNIQIQGRRVKLQDGSFILSLTQGQGSGGIINIRALESVEATGNAPSNGEASIVLTETKDAGRAGDVVIDTAKLVLRNGAQVSSGTFSQGNGGSIIVNASESVEATGIDRNGNFASGLFASSQGSGDGGIIEVTTGRLILRDGGKVSASTFAQGQGGKVLANVSRLIEATGIESQSLKPSGLFASSQGSGDAGTVIIKTEKLILQQGAEISTTTFNQGRGGNVLINASESVEAVGLRSGLKAATVDAAGEGGSIEVNTGRLILQQGAEVSTTTFKQGRGGNVLINASESVEVIGATITAQTEGSRDSGTVTVKTRQFVAKNGAQILAVTFADGNGGKINIQASDVELIGTADNGFPTLIFAATQGNGDGGEIRIETDRLIVREGAQIGAGTFSSGQGGSVVVQASNSVELIGNTPEIADLPFFRDQSGQQFPSGLFTSSQGTGTAGNLRIETDKLTLRDGATIGVNNQGIGDAGNLEVAARNLLLDNQAVLSATTTSGQGGNIMLQIDDLLLLRRNSQISTTAGIDRAGGDGGNITIDAPDGFIVATANQNNDIVANAFQGQGGNININAQSIFGLVQRPSTPPNNTNDIDASSQFGLTGTVTINTPDVDPSLGLVELPSNFTDASQQIVSSCNPGSSARRSSFTLTGRGGIARSPMEPFQGEVSTARWITLDTINTRQNSNVINESPQSPTPEIAEAQGWIVDKNGTVSLVAEVPNITPGGLSVSSNVCQIK